MAESVIQHQMKLTHGIVMSYTRGLEISRGGTDTYVVSFPQELKSVACPVYGCPARAHNTGGLRENFMYRNWKAKDAIIQKGLALIPRCDHCGMHMPAERPYRHKKTPI